MEEKYVGDDNLISCLRTLKDMIVNNKFSDNTKQEIYDTMMCYIEEKHRLDPETVKLLFTGYLMQHLLNNPLLLGGIDPKEDLKPD